jgi:hypothetical protein
LHNIVRLVFSCYASGVALSTVVSLRSQAKFHRTHVCRPVRILAVIHVPKLSQPVFCGTGLLFIVSLLLAAAGVEMRWFTLLALILYFLYFSQIMELSYIVRQTNPIPILLAIFLLAPGVTAPLSVTPPFWPVQAAQVTVACVYFSAALAKLRNSGLNWTSGTQLQAYLLKNYLWRDSPLAWRVAHARRLCAIASSFTLCIEFFFPLAMISPALAIIFVSSVISLHLSSYFLMGINYLRYWWPNYLPFILPIMLPIMR